MVTATGLPASMLTAAELRARYPQINFGPGRDAVFEPDVGVILARRALLSMARWLRGEPAVRLHPYREAVAIDETGTVLLADSTTLAADRVVVAAGPWSRRLMPAGLATSLVMQRQTMLTYAATWTGMPAVLGLGETGDAWLMPPVGDTPARLSAASACRTVPEMTDRLAAPQWRDHLVGRFSALLADFDPAAVTGAADGYYLTDAASGGPLLAGGMPANFPTQAGGPTGSVWAYAACGGLSFKFAPLIARALADRALGRPPRRTGLALVDQPRPLAFDTARRTT